MFQVSSYFLRVILEKDWYDFEMTEIFIALPNRQRQCGLLYFRVRFVAKSLGPKDQATAIVCL